MSTAIVPYFFHPEVTPLRPEDNTAEAIQSEVVFSQSDDDKPILATYGAGPCVIVAGYERSQKIGFVAHFSHAGEVEVGADLILDRLKRMLNEKSGNFSVFLKGGIIDDPVSENTFKAIKKWVSTTNDHASHIALKILSSDPLNSEDEESKSLALDTRSGAIYDYNPMRDNPYYFRHLTMEDLLRTKNSFERQPSLRVAYHP